MLSRSNRSNEMPILATIIFAEKLSEGRGPQATTGEAEQSDTTSTDATRIHSRNGPFRSNRLEYRRGITSKKKKEDPLLYI